MILMRRLVFFYMHLSPPPLENTMLASYPVEYMEVVFISCHFQSSTVQISEGYNYIELFGEIKGEVILNGSHVGRRGERSISYKSVETSPE